MFVFNEAQAVREREGVFLVGGSEAWATLEGSGKRHQITVLRASSSFPFFSLLKDLFLVVITFSIL